MITKVMTVCTGNICRSPLAEGLLRLQVPDVQVFSAGLSAMVGMPATAETVALAHEWGADITAHRAQQLNGFLVQSADLILVAEEAQKRYLERHYPARRGRIFRLAEGSQQDIPDPFRQSDAVYRSSAHLMAQAVAEWAQKIQKLKASS